jgi:hypothetical protein
MFDKIILLLNLSLIPSGLLPLVDCTILGFTSLFFKLVNLKN